MTVECVISPAAKSLQSCPTLCDPRDGSPPGSAVPGTLQARTLERVVISFSNAWKRKVKVKSLSRVRRLATPWTAAHQAPLSMGFSRQEYWSGVPLPSPVISPRLLIYDHYYVEICSLVLKYLSIFVMDFQFIKSFYSSIEMINFFPLLHSVNIMYHMDWIAYIESILASQWWISLDYYNEWSFQCAAELSLVVFYWEVLHLCIRDIACSFFSISLSFLFLFWYWYK